MSAAKKPSQLTKTFLKKGNFGPNVLVQTTLLKFQERVPYRKIQNLFKDVYELEASTNILYNFTGRVADQLRPFYEEIREKVRHSEAVHCDETGISLEGEKRMDMDYNHGKRSLL